MELLFLKYTNTVERGCAVLHPPARHMDALRVGGTELELEILARGGLRCLDPVPPDKIPSRMMLVREKIKNKAQKILNSFEMTKDQKQCKILDKPFNSSSSSFSSCEISSMLLVGVNL